MILVKRIKRVLRQNPRRSLENLFKLGWVLFAAVTALSFVTRLEGTVLALVVLALACIAPLGALILTWSLPLRARIVALLLAYLGITLAFGSTHYLVEHWRPGSYAAADALVGAAAREAQAGGQADLDATQRALRVLRAAQSQGAGTYSRLALHRHLDLEPDTSISLVRGLILAESVLCRRLGGCVLIVERGEAAPISIYPVGDAAADAARELVTAASAAEVQRGIVALTSVLAGEARGTLAELAQLKRRQYRLSLFDFIYFSVVTGTTLGYGDVLPVSRLARLLVILQSMSSIFLISFAFAFFWPQQETARPAAGCHRPRHPRAAWPARPKRPARPTPKGGKAAARHHLPDS